MLFDYLNSINLTKNDLMVDTQAEKKYQPYMINRYLSLFPDTILYASEMNKYPEIPKRQQYEFYINSIAKRKRFAKWPKKEKESKDLKMIAEYFCCSFDKAKTILSILTERQLKELYSVTDVGGRQ